MSDVFVNRCGSVMIGLIDEKALQTLD